jgi:hypothetical protein
MTTASLAYTVRDRLLARWVSTAETYTREGSRTVAYLSAEYLLGPHLGNNVLNLGIEQPVRAAVQELGFNYETLLAQEVEPGLGNGGLGRLAACFLDSLAVEIPWATASATSTAYSRRISSMAGRSRKQMSGSATATVGARPSEWSRGGEAGWPYRELRERLG